MHLCRRFSLLWNQIGIGSAIKERRKLQLFFSLLFSCMFFLLSCKWGIVVVADELREHVWKQFVVLAALFFLVVQNFRIQTISWNVVHMHNATDYVATVYCFCHLHFCVYIATLEPSRISCALHNPVHKQKQRKKKVEKVPTNTTCCGKLLPKIFAQSFFLSLSLCFSLYFHFTRWLLLTWKETRSGTG